MSGLDMTDDDLADLAVLNRAREVLDWYRSFASAGESLPDASELLGAVRVLDLSKNRLTSELSLAALRALGHWD